VTSRRVRCRILLAGAFCTNQYVVGTGAFIRPQINGLNNAESGTYAQFWVSANDGACFNVNIKLSTSASLVGMCRSYHPAEALNDKPISGLAGRARASTKPQPRDVICAATNNMFTCLTVIRVTPGQRLYSAPQPPQWLGGKCLREMPFLPCCSGLWSD